MASFYMRQPMPLIPAYLLDLKVEEAGCEESGSVKGKN
jgi:hypothetical protein